MRQPAKLDQLSKTVESILAAPFEWCHVDAGAVNLADASNSGGTIGGTFQVDGFAIGKYQLTNRQFQKFLDDPNGFNNPAWWEYSPEGILWRKGHANPAPTAFAGHFLPRTRVSWFDSMAFCAWLSSRIDENHSLKIEEPATWRVCLPAEQEWQRAALGDTGWSYPWGAELDETRANFGRKLGHPSDVGSFPNGQSPFGVMDMTGNVFEWCVNQWQTHSIDPAGYAYRIIRGGAWNNSTPEYLQATDRGTGWSPRGRLNDCGLRCLLSYTA